MAAITASGSIVNNSFRDIIMSPEGAVRFCWGRDVGLYRCPRGAEGVSEHIHDGINAYVSATKKWQSVARECRAALLWNDVGLKRLPRVLKESPGLFKTASMRTLQRRKRGKVLPEGVAQNCWETI